MKELMDGVKLIQSQYCDILWQFYFAMVRKRSLLHPLNMLFVIVLQVFVNVMICVMLISPFQGVETK